MKTSRVKNLIELTGNIFKRFQSDDRDERYTFFGEIQIFWRPEMLLYNLLVTLKAWILGRVTI